MRRGCGQWGVAFLLVFLCNSGVAGVATAEETATRDGKQGANAPGSSAYSHFQIA